MSAQVRIDKIRRIRPISIIYIDKNELRCYNQYEGICIGIREEFEYEEKSYFVSDFKFND